MSVEYVLVISGVSNTLVPPRYVFLDFVKKKTKLQGLGSTNCDQ